VVLITGKPIMPYIHVSRSPSSRLPHTKNAGQGIFSYD
jgi:hypothetical protein